jgi:hypothetical protein
MVDTRAIAVTVAISRAVWIRFRELCRANGVSLNKGVEKPFSKD